MPDISVLKTSKFLKKEDVTPAVLVTIKDCIEYNVAQEGAPEEHKWCLTFNELEKPMVLNSTNGQIIAGMIGSTHTDNWRGHRVVLYVDPNVSMSGKLVGGIRVRAPKNQPKPAQPQAPPPVAAQPAPAPAPAWPTEIAGTEDSEVPF